MTRRCRLGFVSFITGLALSVVAGADTVVVQDDFSGKLADGWRLLREDRSAWRVEDQALRIKIQPGNMWGPSNDAKNVLVRDLPAVGDAGLSIGMHVENVPTAQYEQVDLVWYYDDSHMVKIGLELVDGEICLVMGREEGDKTRTITKPPITDTALELRLSVRGAMITGEYRSATHGWLKAGECNLPGKGAAKASIQCYQGPEDLEHWAKITAFRVTKLEK